MKNTLSVEIRGSRLPGHAAPVTDSMALLRGDKLILTK